MDFALVTTQFLGEQQTYVYTADVDGNPLTETSAAAYGAQLKAIQDAKVGSPPDSVLTFTWASIESLPDHLGAPAQAVPPDVLPQAAPDTQPPITGDNIGTSPGTPDASMASPEAGPSIDDAGYDASQHPDLHGEVDPRDPAHEQSTEDVIDEIEREDNARDGDHLGTVDSERAQGLAPDHTGIVGDLPNTEEHDSLDEGTDGLSDTVRGDVKPADKPKASARPRTGAKPKGPKS